MKYDELDAQMRVFETAFGRKLRKLDSILASEASAKFSLLLGSIGCFDCRISQLPTADLVVDYFRWRISHCLDLPMKEAYSDFVVNLLMSAET